MQNSKNRGGRSTDKDAKLMQLGGLLAILNQSEFTGYVKVNYSQGSIARVEKMEEVFCQARVVESAPVST